MRRRGVLHPEPAFPGAEASTQDLVGIRGSPILGGWRLGRAFLRSHCQTLARSPSPAKTAVRRLVGPHRGTGLWGGAEQKPVPLSQPAAVQKPVPLSGPRRPKAHRGTGLSGVRHTGGQAFCVWADQRPVPLLLDPDEMPVPLSSVPHRTNSLSLYHNPRLSKDLSPCRGRGPVESPPPGFPPPYLQARHPPCPNPLDELTTTPSASMREYPRTARNRRSRCIRSSSSSSESRPVRFTWRW